MSREICEFANKSLYHAEACNNKRDAMKEAAERIVSIKKNDRVKRRVYVETTSRIEPKNNHAGRTTLAEFFFATLERKRGETRKHPGEAPGYSLNFDLISVTFSLTSLPVRSFVLVSLS